MKFLCVRCDVPLKLLETRPPADGSLTILYACPTCGHRVAMLTNPHETQLVTSLGVRLGPEERDSDRASGCPFAEVAREAAERAARDEGLEWTPEARRRLERIPEFVRPMARAGIEHYARERGLRRVDEALLDEAREHFGM